MANKEYKKTLPNVLFHLNHLIMEVQDEYNIGRS